MACVHGGVRPRVEHGSKVTNSVAPRVEWPFFTASSMAFTSACANPARRCQPRPMILPRRTNTAPTNGFGDVSPLARLAKRSASRIHCSSVLKVGQRT